MLGDTSVAAHSGDTSVAHQTYEWRRTLKYASLSHLIALIGGNNQYPDLLRGRFESHIPVPRQCMPPSKELLAIEL
jgi:hypothetical protein